MTVAVASRRERRRLEIRDRILESGVELFETHGFEDTTVNQICEGADIAYGTFFNHFPTKLDLLRELADRSLREMQERFEEISKQPGSFGEHVVRLFEETAEETVASGPKTRELVGAMVSMAYSESAVSDDRRMRVAFRNFLQEGVVAGDVRDDVDLDTLTEVAVGTWYSMFLAWVHEEDYPLVERASAVARFLAQTLSQTPPPTAPNREN